MRLWVDTDFGFDDLWALLVLKHLNIKVDGISLVAGNAPLPQVARNAEASQHAFGFAWPVFQGAVRPLQREPETAERILGTSGMCSRGRVLPYADLTAVTQGPNLSATDAMAAWLHEDNGSHQIIALGPLTNLANLVLHHPDAVTRIEQITWLGGSRGRGNHSPYAEYNALADPEALSIVADSDIPLRMIDLDLCRQVSFGESDMPTMQGDNQQLITDLLGGYLDIALQRGRATMSIYDPLAVLAVANTDLFEFVPASLTVHTDPDDRYGQTIINSTANQGTTNFEIAVNVDAVSACTICMASLLNA